MVFVCLNYVFLRCGYEVEMIGCRCLKLAMCSKCQREGLGLRAQRALLGFSDIYRIQSQLYHPTYF